MDYINKKIGKLKVISLGEKDKNGNKRYNCICDCGRKTLTYKSTLKNKNASCGCVRLENTIDRSTKHGMTKTRTYKSWQSMKRRCYSENHDAYYRYGARGIKVCDRWLESFENFYEDMGNRPDKCTLDRIDPNGNYEPSNCRWADGTEQATNLAKKRMSNINMSNISKDKKGYKVDLTRYGKRRRISCIKDIETAIRIKEYWISSYEKDKEEWLKDTEENTYKIKTIEKLELG